MCTASMWSIDQQLSSKYTKIGLTARPLLPPSWKTMSHVAALLKRDTLRWPRISLKGLTGAFPPSSIPHLLTHMLLYSEGRSTPQQPQSAAPLAYSTTRHPKKKVHIELIKDKSTRHIAFSKRKVCCVAAYWCSDCV